MFTKVTPTSSLSFHRELPIYFPSCSGCACTVSLYMKLWEGISAQSPAAIAKPLISRHYCCHWVSLHPETHPRPFDGLQWGYKPQAQWSHRYSGELWGKFYFLLFCNMLLEGYQKLLLKYQWILLYHLLLRVLPLSKMGIYVLRAVNYRKIQLTKIILDLTSLFFDW